MSSDLEAFVAASAPRLFGFALALCRHHADAEDLLQETLVRVSLGWSKVAVAGSPYGYARRTMVNHFLNSQRGRSRERSALQRLAAMPVSESAAVADLEVPRTLLAQLPPKQRAAVAMRYVLDLDDAQIADALGVSTSTVRSQIARGLATLRGIMEESQL